MFDQTIFNNCAWGGVLILISIFLYKPSVDLFINQSIDDLRLVVERVSFNLADDIFDFVPDNLFLITRTADSISVD